jgi:hypothetical protein
MFLASKYFYTRFLGRQLGRSEGKKRKIYIEVDG